MKRALVAGIAGQDGSYLADARAVNLRADAVEGTWRQVQ